MKEYLKKIISSDSKESSKRFIAIWAMILVTAAVIVALTKCDNTIEVLYVLLGFVASLLGITSWQSIRTKKHENNKNSSDNSDEIS